jgi:putative inorganic carbon (hco3(-)) transporter
VLFILAFAPPEARERLSNTGDDRGSGRVDIWQIGWRMVEANPLNGVGLGNFRSSLGDYLVQPGLIRRSDLILDEPKVAHNIYLGVLAETGAVGLILFTGIIVFALGCALTAARTFEISGDARMALLSRGVLIGLSGVLAASFFSGQIFLKPLWLTLALCPALLMLARSEQGRAASDHGSTRAADDVVAIDRGPPTTAGS